MGKSLRGVAVERVSGPVCLVLFIALLVAGLWPFDFYPENRATWLQGANGLAFHGDSLESGHSAGGIALSPAQLASRSDPAAAKGAMSMEIRLKPYEELGWCAFHILDLYDPWKDNLFRVSQWNHDLLIRVSKRAERGREAWKEIGADGVLNRGRTAFITLTSGQSGTALYLDGRLAGSFQDVRLLPPNQSISTARVRIGNSLDGGCAWSGEISGLSFYDRVLSDDEVASNHRWWVQESSPVELVQDGLVGAYPFDEGRGVEAHSVGGLAAPLSIPPRLDFQKRLLSVPELGSESRRSLLKDGVVNVFGFVPFGFFLSMWLVRGRRWLPRRASFLTVCAGMSISLFIESAQVLLPGRDSSLLDLCYNTIGTGSGVIAFHFYELMQGSCEAKSRMQETGENG